MNTHERKGNASCDLLPDYRQVSYTMPSILVKLQYLDFPENSKEALNYLVRCCSESTHQGIPGLGGISENYVGEVAQEYILNLSRRRGHNARVSKKRPSSVSLQFYKQAKLSRIFPPISVLVFVLSPIRKKFGTHV